MLASLIHTSSLYPHVLRLCRVGFVVYICVQLPELLADASVRSQLVPGAFSAGWLCGNHICFRQLLHFVIVVEAHDYAAAVQWGIVCSPQVSECFILFIQMFYFAWFKDFREENDTVWNKLLIELCGWFLPSFYENNNSNILLLERNKLLCHHGSGSHC